LGCNDGCLDSGINIQAILRAKIVETIDSLFLGWIDGTLNIESIDDLGNKDHQEYPEDDGGNDANVHGEEVAKSCFLSVLHDVSRHLVRHEDHWKKADNHGYCEKWNNIETPLGDELNEFHGTADCVENGKYTKNDETNSNWDAAATWDDLRSLGHGCVIFFPSFYNYQT